MLRLRSNEHFPEDAPPESALSAPPAADAWIDLCWWWEERPAGALVPLRGDLLAARRCVAGLGARAELVLEIRRFLREERPWLSSSPDDREVIDHLATALAAGQVHLAEPPVGGGAAEEAKAPPEPWPPAKVWAERAPPAPAPELAAVKKATPFVMDEEAPSSWEATIEIVEPPIWTAEIEIVEPPAAG